MLSPRKKNIPVVILEFKHASTPAPYRKTAKEALLQIETKNYAAALRQEKVQKFFSYAISFFGKTRWIESRLVFFRVAYKI